MNRFLLSCLSLLAAGAAPSGLFAQEAEDHQALIEETVALAREYLGGARKLDAIDTIRYQGVLVYGSGESGTVESVFKRPNRHQFISVINNQRETSTLNRTEAWRKMENLDQPGAYSLDFYQVDDLRHLEATVIDTLSFMKAPPTRNGRIEYLGTEEVEGVETRVLLYRHSDSIWFRKYIDPETGRLLHMVNSKGVVFTYQGEILVDGVRFPEKVVVRFRTQFGQQSMEVSYSTITLNAEIDTERFRVPVSGG